MRRKGRVAASVRRKRGQARAEAAPPQHRPDTGIATGWAPRFVAPRGLHLAWRLGYCMRHASLQPAADAVLATPPAPHRGGVVASRDAPRSRIVDKVSERLATHRETRVQYRHGLGGSLGVQPGSRAEAATPEAAERHQ